MPRVARQAAASGVYHIMWRRNDKMYLFRDDADNIHFLSILRDVQDDNFTVLAYCLMGNHLHLLIKTAKANTTLLESAMKKVGIRFASYYNRRYERNGHLFQDRFRSRPVETTSYFLRALRYIHLNPVVAGVVQNPQDYPWSSYRDYFCDRQDAICPVNINYAFILHTQEWLQTWHTLTEPNPNAFSETESRITDYQATVLIHQLYGLQPQDIVHQPPDKQQTMFRRLICEEKIRVPQLSRLTGISRGVIKRFLL